MRLLRVTFPRTLLLNARKLIEAVIVADASSSVRESDQGQKTEFEALLLRSMLERTYDRFGLNPEMLVADTAYGSAGYWAGRSRKRGLRHIFRSSTSPRAAMTLSSAPILSMISGQTTIAVPQGRCWYIIARRAGKLERPVTGPPR